MNTLIKTQASAFTLWFGSKHRYLGIVFRLGKFKDIRGPGLFFIIPVIEQVRIIDTRVLAVHIPKQQVITRDNVPVTIDAALFYRVVNAADAIIQTIDGLGASASNTVVIAVPVELMDACAKLDRSASIGRTSVAEQGPRA